MPTVLEIGRCDDAAAFNLALARMVPRYDELGVEVLELSRRHVVARVPLEHNQNHYGTMFAGAIFAVSEVLGGALFMANFDLGPLYGTVKDFSIAFRRPGLTDATVRTSIDETTLRRIHGEVAETGRTSFRLEAEVTDDGGTTIATTAGVYCILSAP